MFRILNIPVKFDNYKNKLTLNKCYTILHYIVARYDYIEINNFILSSLFINYTLITVNINSQIGSISLISNHRETNTVRANKLAVNTLG